MMKFISRSKLVFGLSLTISLPLSVQSQQTVLPSNQLRFDGKRWREMELLAIAHEISKVVGDFQHPSGY